MDMQARSAAVMTATNVVETVTGVDTFHLDILSVRHPLSFDIPGNLRLGHLIERVVAALIDQSTNYDLVFHGVQLVEDKMTLGELDYIIREVDSHRVIHLELGYKFYLYDPAISSTSVNNWIGPNRKDSLIDKLTKLRDRQFPLLYHPKAAEQLPQVDVDMVEQRLCLLASLYVPYGFSQKEILENVHAIKGYYLDLHQYREMHTSSKTYYMPAKHRWGLSPEQHTSWLHLEEVLPAIQASLAQHRSFLCWERDGRVYKQYFIVWWSVSL